MSLFRAYRYMACPGPHKLETVYDGPGVITLYKVIRLVYQVMSRKGLILLLGIPKYQPSTKIVSTINPRVLWSPGSLNLRT